jgi:hypothetical protein
MQRSGDRSAVAGDTARIADAAPGSNEVVRQVRMAGFEKVRYNRA